MVRKLEDKVDGTPEIDLSKWEKVEPTGNKGYFAMRDFSIGKRFLIREKLNSRRVKQYAGIFRNIQAMGTISQAIFEVDQEFREGGHMGITDPYHSANLGRIKEAYRARS